MRHRWAAAVVVLASVLWLQLCAPALAADRYTTARPAAAAAPHHEAATDGPEGAAESAPGEDDAPVRRSLARTPRPPGAAGAHAPAAGTPSAATVERHTRRPCPQRPAQRPGPGDAARGAAALQTFRC